MDDARMAPPAPDGDRMFAPPADQAARPDQPRDERFDLLLDDVALLIDYLGRHRPGRLDACFDDSRGDLSRPAGVPIAPAAEEGTPPSKVGFLRRWASIDTRAKGGAAVSASGGTSQVDDLVFLVAARGFLAALAWPATVHSIRLTQAYVGEAPMPRSAGAATSDSRDAQAGDRLKRRVYVLRVACVVLVAVTVITSMFGFYGKRLLEEQDRLLTFLAAVSTDIGAEQRPATGPAPSAAPGTTNPPNTSVPEPNLQYAYCDVPFMDHRGSVRFVSPKQETLCNRLWGVNRTINQMSYDLENWGNGFLTGALMSLGGLSSGGPSGRVRVFAEAARPLNASEALRLVQEASSTQMPDDAGKMADDAQKVFNERSYVGEQHRAARTISPTQARVMIEALSLYIMPCLYALLGAFVAMFQQLKRRADAFTLDRSDGAQAIQTLVFGLVFGALVGILADMLRAPPASGAASDEVALGISVIALLAGYAVAHVFRFLDNFADRVFGAAPQTSENAR